MTKTTFPRIVYITSVVIVAVVEHAKHYLDCSTVRLSFPDEDSLPDWLTSFTGVPYTTDAEPNTGIAHWREALLKELEFMMTTEVRQSATVLKSLMYCRLHSFNHT